MEAIGRHFQGMPWGPALALVRRELISQLRHRTAFRNLIFLLLPLIALMCFMMYVSNQDQGFRTGASFSAYYFRLYTVGLYLACTLTATTMGALGICSEREQDTYDMLHMTCISPRAVIIGKLVSALGVCVLTIIAALPLLGIQFFFTGIEPQQFIGALAIILVTTLSAGMASLSISAASRRTLPALARSFFTVILVNGGGLLILFVVFAFLSAPLFRSVYASPALIHLLSAMCPPLALLNISATYSLGPLIAVILFHSLWIVARWRRCIHLIEQGEEIRAPQVDERPQATTTLSTAPPSRIARLFAPPWPLPDGRNPIYFKERMESVLALRRNTLKIFLGVSGLCLLASVAILNSRNGNDGEELLYYLSTGIFLLLIPSLIAPAIAREHAYGNLDALRTTLLMPEDILRGKLFAAARNLAIVLAAIVIGAMPIFLERIHDRGIIAYAISTAVALIVSAAYTLSLSLLSACTCTNPRQGLVRAYAVSISALWLLPFALGSGVSSYYMYRPPDWAFHMVCLSPYYAQALNFDLNRYEMLNFHWAFNVAVFAMVAFTVYRIALYRFRRTYFEFTGRTSDTGIAAAPVAERLYSESSTPPPQAGSGSAHE